METKAHIDTVYHGFKRVFISFFLTFFSTLVSLTYWRQYCSLFLCEVKAKATVHVWRKNFRHFLNDQQVSECFSRSPFDFYVNDIFHCRFVAARQLLHMAMIDYLKNIFFCAHTLGKNSLLWNNKQWHWGANWDS